MKQLIKELKEQLKEYQQLVNEYEERGIDNLDYEDTEYYGVYVGKVEILNEVITKLENL